MIRVIIDTNILVSASLAKGYSFRIINEIALDTGLIQICLSEAILLEYSALVYYDRIIKKYPAFVNNLTLSINTLEKSGLFYFPKRNFNILADVSDNKFLNLAYESKAHYLITGNHNDFSITEFESTKILSSKKFCELYDQNLL